MATNVNEAGAAKETSAQAVRRLVETGKAGDYLPIVGWFHFPLADPDPNDFFDETVRRTEQFGWDIVKIMTNGNYIPIAYGADYEYSTNPHKWDGVFHSHPIASPDDAAHLPALTLENPTLSREVAIAKRLVDHYAGTKPVIATLFDPLSWVQELSTPLNPVYALELLHDHPDKLRPALDALQATNEAFLDGLFDAGIDGIFFATKFSTTELLTKREHDAFVEPYLKATAEKLAGRTWFNMLHVHGKAGLMFDELLPLGFQSYNWESVGPAEGLTTIAELRAKSDAVFVSGYDEKHDFAGDATAARELIGKRLADALEQNAGGALVFGPGCSGPLDIDTNRFEFVQQAAVAAGLR